MDNIFSMKSSKNIYFLNSNLNIKWEKKKLLKNKISLRALYEKKKKKISKILKYFQIKFSFFYILFPIK